MGASEFDDELLTAFAAVLRAYDTETLQTHEYRDAACREIWNARAWLAWQRMLGDVETASLPPVMLLVAEGVFADCWSEAERHDFFPTPEYLRSLLRGSELERLARLGLSLPRWLT